MHVELCYPFRLGSWTYDGYKVELALWEESETNEMTSVNVDFYDKSCPMKTSNEKYAINIKKYPCCDEPYPSFDVSFDVNTK